MSTPQALKFGSVCSGIEAASAAWGPLGWQAAWFSEIEPFPSAVLAHHYPDVPNLGDMTTLPGRIASGEVEAPDVFCGGTPCQAFSVAGLRKSLGDARGNLSLTFCEIANAIDDARLVRGEPATIVFWENVPGVLSTSDNAFGCFLAALVGGDEPLNAPDGWPNAGCVSGPQRTAAWRVLDAQYFGLAQRRRRVFVVASARNGFDPAAVLFEWDGLRRDTAPSREAGKVAPTIPSRSTAGGGLGTDFDLDGGVIQAFGGNRTSGPIDVSPALTVAYAIQAGALRTNPDSGPDGVGIQAEHAYTLEARSEVQCVAAPIAFAQNSRDELRLEGEDGTGRGTPLVPVHCRDLAQTITSNYGKQVDSSDTALGPNIVAFDTTQITSQTNRSNPEPGDPCHPLAAGAHAPAIAFPANLSGTQCASSEELAPSLGALNPTAVAFQERGREGGRTLEIGGEVAYALTAPSGGGRAQERNVLTPAMQVRRLTPTECERLQGFPDGYTDIPWRAYQEAARKGISYEAILALKGLTLSGPDRDQCPDGPRYKALGNSWAVPVVAWIGRRIQKALEAA
jgi:DNA (cytosine-5)-methyltransferase 1